MEWLDWRGCYDDRWDGLIVDEAFSHPAKFAYGLVTRIVDHGLAEGYWAPGDLVGDPFGGVALGGLVCGGRGLHWAGVELEERFVGLGNQNIERNRLAFGDTDVRLVQGDSRRFHEIVGGLAGVVTSPPFAEVEPYQDKTFRLNDGRKALPQGQDGYGSTPGQIGALKAGAIDAVITSPPYADSVKGDHGETETAEHSRETRRTQGGSLGQSQRSGGYGASAGNIGNLHGGRLDGVVTSPPYEDGLGHGDGRTDHPLYAEKRLRSQACDQYGDTAGNIGNSSGETYWEAMAQVYASVRLALKPGGVMACVVKDYVKNKKRVPLCDDTATLLESLVFEVFARARAWVVKKERHPCLFGGEVVKTTERKSFFRRLAEKNGSPSIDWEEVIWCRRVDA